MLHDGDAVLAASESATSNEGASDTQHNDNNWLISQPPWVNDRLIKPVM